MTRAPCTLCGDVVAPYGEAGAERCAQHFGRYPMTGVLALQLAVLCGRESARTEDEEEQEYLDGLVDAWGREAEARGVVGWIDQAFHGAPAPEF